MLSALRAAQTPEVPLKRCILGFVFVCFSLITKAGPIPKELLQNYQRAAVVALQPAMKTFETIAYSGTFPHGVDVQRIVQLANSAEISADGSQPLLTFSYQDNSNLSVVILTTSADYKTIENCKLNTFIWTVKAINTGNLRTPVVKNTGVWESAGNLEWARRN